MWSFGFSPAEYFRDILQESSNLHNIISENFSVRNIYDIGSKCGDLSLNLRDSQNYFYFETRKEFRLLSEKIFQSFRLKELTE